METWWIARGRHYVIIANDWHLTGGGFPAKVAKSKIGPYWTRGEAARVLRLWNGFSG